MGVVWTIETENQNELCVGVQGERKLVETTVAASNALCPVGARNFDMVSQSSNGSRMHGTGVHKQACPNEAPLYQTSPTENYISVAGESR